MHFHTGPLLDWDTHKDRRLIAGVVVGAVAGAGAVAVIIIMFMTL